MSSIDFTKNITRFSLHGTKYIQYDFHEKKTVVEIIQYYSVINNWLYVFCYSCSQNKYIVVLHPFSIVVHGINRIAGSTDHGISLYTLNTYNVV